MCIRLLRLHGLQMALVGDLALHLVLLVLAPADLILLGLDELLSHALLTGEFGHLAGLADVNSVQVERLVVGVLLSELLGGVEAAEQGVQVGQDAALHSVLLVDLLGRLGGVDDLAKGIEGVFGREVRVVASLAEKPHQKIVVLLVELLEFSLEGSFVCLCKSGTAMQIIIRYKLTSIVSVEGGIELESCCSEKIVLWFKPSWWCCLAHLDDERLKVGLLGIAWPGIYIKWHGPLFAPAEVDDTFKRELAANENSSDNYVHT